MVRFCAEQGCNYATATEIASLAHEVNVLTKYPDGMARTRGTRLALESWAKRSDRGNVIPEGSEDYGSHSRSKRQMDTRSDQSSGDERSKGRMEKEGKMQRQISRKKSEEEKELEQDLEEYEGSLGGKVMRPHVNMAQSHIGLTPPRIELVQPHVDPVPEMMPKVGMTPPVNKAATFGTEAGMLDDIEMPVLTKMTTTPANSPAWQSPAVDSNNNSASGTNESISMLDLRKVPGFNLFVKQWGRKKKRPRQSTSPEELDTTLIDKTQYSEQGASAVLETGATARSIEMTELYHLDDKDWSPESTMTSPTNAIMPPAASDTHVKTSRPQSVPNPPSTIATVAPRPTSYENIPGLFIHMARGRSNWRLEVADTTEVLVIGDSNMKSALEVPKGWEIHSLSGGRMEHVNDLLRKMQTPKALKVLIVQVGINHRDTGYPQDEIKVLRQIADQLRLRLLMQGISISKMMPPSMQSKLNQFNEQLHETFGAFFIFPQRDRKVGLDPDDETFVHYDPSTMQRQLNGMATRLRDLKLSISETVQPSRSSTVTRRTRTSGDGKSKY